MKRIISLLLVVLFTLGVWTGTGLASDVRDKPVTLTLNEAISMALSHSKAIKKAGLNVDRAEEDRQDAKKIVSFIPTGVGPYLPEVEAAYTNLLTKELQWQMSKRSLTAAEDTVVLDTCRKYWAVQAAQRAVDAQKAALEQARGDLHAAEASYAVGMLSEEGLLGGRAAFEHAKGALEAAQYDLELAYIAFNDEVGLGREERPVLAEEVVYVPLDVADLQNAVQRTVEQNPHIWQREQLIVIADKVRYLQDNWNIADIDMQLAELDAADLKDAMQILGRTIYYSARKAEESYPAAREVLEVAKESLRVAELKHEVGLITRTEVAKAEAQVAEAEKNLYNLITQQAYLKLACEKPWAYNPGPASGSGI